ncbi:M20 family metallopeptidase [Vitiosangium sp. GDMCC 1.1324]|uniref:M20 metallopeptidase family protein n=1 Tax=Vitiosangium sp. (strain GDMCC 1.1324) TaxID=2138576 RepID=UPI000D3C8DD0|nr:amidohydrolase [Vitiosangium sp. GDMCC 1.1324]PTL78721.1 amidohydrolase [Vitiosangium sp. GDMCC 1.1324]
MNLAEPISKWGAEATRWRRHLHMHPERSFQEHRTAAFVQEKLASFGLEVRSGVGGLGVVAELVGEGEGPVLALRADMDALPIPDSKECEYRSRVEGVTHACGHDGHTATLLAAAAVLSELRGALGGSIRFLFQPAEETPPGGARPMVEQGALEGVSEVFGLHYAPFPVGKVCVPTGLMMGLVDTFTIRLRGVGGHAAYPHLGADAAHGAAQLLVALQSIVSRQVDPLRPAVLTVGQLSAGHNHNTIAEQAEMRGTVRCLTPAIRDTIRERLTSMSHGIAAMFQLTAEVQYEEGYPPVVNHAASAEYVGRVCRQALGADCVLPMPPSLASDDFACFLQQRPGCYFMVGSAGADAATQFPLHHPRFDLDERALTVGTRLLVGIALGRLASTRKQGA